MTQSSHYRQIVRQFLSTLPSGHVFRSREVFDWVQANAIIEIPDLMPPNRPAWRSSLSKALHFLAGEGAIIHANQMPHCQVWVVP